MNVEWKAIFDALMEGADDIKIYSYRLNDGSYIMAEELEYDPYFNVLFLDLPVLINVKRNGSIALVKWMFQSEYEEENLPPQPIELQCNKIIAKTEAPITLKRDYLKFNFLDKLHGSLDRDEFESMVNEIQSYNLDNPNSSNTSYDPLIDMYNKRLKYPDKN